MTLTKRITAYQIPSRIINDDSPPAQESFNDWGGGRGCYKCVHVLRGDGTKIAPPGDLFDQPSGEMNYIWGKLADHIEDHVVLFPEGVVLVTSPGTESSYPRPPQSLKHSQYKLYVLIPSHR